MEIKYRKKHLSREVWEAIATDYNKGMKIEEIMAKYDISKSQIYYILSKLSNKQASV